MAFQIIYLSENLRKRLFKLSIFISCLQLILSILEVCIGFYKLMSLSSQLHSTLKEWLTVSLMYFFCFGILSLLLSIINIRMSQNFVSKPPMKNIRYFHEFWIKISIISIGLNTFYVFTIPEIFDRLCKLINDMLLHGILYYLSDPSWKNTFDYFQTNLKCCGIDKYTDWYEIPWISIPELPKDVKVLPKYIRADGKALLPIVPKSCCIPNIPKSKCYNDIEHQLETEIIQPVPIQEIYTNGCIQLINNKFYSIAISVVILGILITASQLLIITVGRYLYTSSRNSLLMGTPNGVAPGWLFGRGDFGYIGGEPLFPSENESSTYVIPEKKKNSVVVKRKTHRNNSYAQENLK